MCSFNTSFCLRGSSPGSSEESLSIAQHIDVLYTNNESQNSFGIWYSPLWPFVTADILHFPSLSWLNWQGKTIRETANRMWETLFTCFDSWHTSDILTHCWNPVRCSQASPQMASRAVAVLCPPPATQVLSEASKWFESLQTSVKYWTLKERSCSEMCISDTRG